MALSVTRLYDPSTLCASPDKEEYCDYLVGHEAVGIPYHHSPNGRTWPVERTERTGELHDRVSSRDLRYETSGRESRASPTLGADLRYGLPRRIGNEADDGAMDTETESPATLRREVSPGGERR